MIERAAFATVRNQPVRFEGPGKIGTNHSFRLLSGTIVRGTASARRPTPAGLIEARGVEVRRMIEHRADRLASARPFRSESTSEHP